MSAKTDARIAEMILSVYLKDFILNGQAIVHNLIF